MNSIIDIGEIAKQVVSGRHDIFFLFDVELGNPHRILKVDPSRRCSVCSEIIFGKLYSVRGILKSGFNLDRILSIVEILSDV